MASESYAVAIGRVVLDLYALDSVLRRYLEHLEASVPAAEEFPSISDGDTLSSNVATNRDSLGSLIEKFNRSVAAAKQAELSVDVSVAGASAVLTAGRIWGSSLEAPLRIVQFSSPSNGLVRCTSSVLMDTAWLEEQDNRVRTARANVEEAGRRIQPDRWVPASERSQVSAA